MSHALVLLLIFTATRNFSSRTTRYESFAYGVKLGFVPVQMYSTLETMLERLRLRLTPLATGPRLTP
jgi:threonine/homoserine efflux transporter RhtA